MSMRRLVRHHCVFMAVSYLEAAPTRCNGANPRFLFCKDTILRRKNIHYRGKKQFFQLKFSFLVKVRYISPLNN